MSNLTSLIDKQDTFEIVRDRIAVILANEVANQMALATAAAKDPDDWKLRIYTERGNAWEQFLTTPVVDKSPIVNVWFNADQFNKNVGTIATRQKADGVFNIDCYGYGESADVPGGGHTPGDQKAAFESHRAMRLVRNIIMDQSNVRLQFSPNVLVWDRWVQGRETFQPTQGQRTIQNVVGSRITLQVGYNEFPVTPDESTILQLVASEIKRESDGLVLAQVDIDTTV
jgi:hypothetical protein